MGAADLVAKATRRTPSKVNPRTMQTLCRFLSQFLHSGQQHLLQELVDFHAAKVNPRRLVMAPAFFETLTNEKALEDAPLLRYYLCLSTIRRRSVLTRHPDPRKQISLITRPSRAS